MHYMKGDDTNLFYDPLASVVVESVNLESESILESPVLESETKSESTE